ncbi:Uncharacterised protein [uncultured archaeon]|nr:Uncharacterised protein [uncultured archaeon]
MNFIISCDSYYERGICKSNYCLGVHANTGWVNCGYVYTLFIDKVHLRGYDRLMLVCRNFITRKIDILILTKSTKATKYE